MRIKNLCRHLPALMVVVWSSAVFVVPATAFSLSAPRMVMPSLTFSAKAVRWDSPSRLQAQEDDGGNENGPDNGAMIPSSSSPTLLIASASIGSIAASMGTLWSETSVYLSGCGPLEMPDVVERICYQWVLLVAGICWFTRIAFQRDMAGLLLGAAATITKDDDEERAHRRVWQMRQVQMAELFSYLAVIGAFVVLLNQFENGAQMDGLSGIDIELCKAKRDFSVILLER